MATGVQIRTPASASAANPLKNQRFAWPVPAGLFSLLSMLSAVALALFGLARALLALVSHGAALRDGLGRLHGRRMLLAVVALAVLLVLAPRSGIRHGPALSVVLLVRVGLLRLVGVSNAELGAFRRGVLTCEVQQQMQVSLAFSP